MPTSTLTRPANTTGYTTGQLVASNTVAASVVSPSWVNDAPVGDLNLTKLLLLTNAITGWGALSVLVNLWSSAPTYTNGDGGTYAVATGAAKFLGQFSGKFVQFADGAAAELIPAVGVSIQIEAARGAGVYWDLQVVGSATPKSGQTFTLQVPEPS